MKLALRQDRSGNIRRVPVTRTGVSTMVGVFVSTRAGGDAGPVYGAATGERDEVLAQRIERRIKNPEVAGSIPVNFSTG